jgi:hypothetical protein
MKNGQTIFGARKYIYKIKNICGYREMGKSIKNPVTTKIF